MSKLDDLYAAAKRANKSKAKRKPAKRKATKRKATRRRKPAKRRMTDAQAYAKGAALLAAAGVAVPPRRRKPAKRRKTAKRKPAKRRKAAKRTAKRAPKSSRSRRPGESFKQHMARLRKVDGPRKRKAAKRKPAKRRKAAKRTRPWPSPGSKRAPKSSRSRRPGESFKQHMARLRKVDGR